MNYRLLILVLILLIAGCSQSTDVETDPEPGPDPMFEPISETVPDGNQDPGFFLDNWQSKNITAPSFQEKAKPEGGLDSRIQINTENVITKAPAGIYGNNVNPYNTQMGNDPTIISYLKDLQPRLIRFPGGNLSNLYFWDRDADDRPDDIPPVEELLESDGSPRQEDTYWFGKNEADWTMSLNNYYKLLQETNSKGVITVNFAVARYGRSENPVAKAAGYAADWVRYDNGRTRYWEIENENYGEWQSGYRINTDANKDGQPALISGELYGEFATVFMDLMRTAADEIGADIKIGTQLYEKDPSASRETEVITNWNEGYFRAAGNASDYYIVDNYYTSYLEDSEPKVILNSATDGTADMMQWLNKTTGANGVEFKPVALTEWNIFATGSQQQVSDISGMHAAMVLGETIKYEFGMTQRWDLANAWSGGNDHGMFNAPGNGSAPGVSAWNPRADFFHMYYFQQFFGNQMVWSGTQGDKALLSYASTFSSGQVGVVIANTDSSSKMFDVQLKNSEAGDRYYWYTLEGGSGAGEYSRKVTVNGQGPEGVSGGPKNYGSIEARGATTAGEEGIKLSAPAYSVIYLLIDRP